MTNALVDAARSYLAAGLQIIALTGKLPNTFFHKHGLKDYISGVPENAEDDALIERVFTHPTTSGLAIVIPYPYVVIDVDGEEGAQRFQWIMETVKIDERTPVSRTPRGLHIWYADIYPWANGSAKGKLDIKSINGYVVAPPSLHPNGGRYRWLRELVDEGSGQINPPIEIPTQLRDYLAGVQMRVAAAEVERPVLMQWQLVVGDDRHVVFQNLPLQPDLGDLVARLLAEPVDSGSGNRLLHWAACVATEEGNSLQAIYDAFLPVVTKQWADPMPTPAARSTIRSGFKKVTRT